MSSLLADRHIAVGAANLEDQTSLQSSAGDIGLLPVWRRGGQTHGIWQMTPGTLTGVSGPETVVVLGGRAEVTVQPGGRTFHLRPGDLFVLDKNETATWKVSETIRKFYVKNSDA